MQSITTGVEFDTIAREWRCKWSAENDKSALQEAQKALEGILDEVKKTDGVKSVRLIGRIRNNNRLYFMSLTTNCVSPS